MANLATSFIHLMPDYAKVTVTRKKNKWAQSAKTHWKNKWAQSAKTHWNLQLSTMSSPERAVVHCRALQNWELFRWRGKRTSEPSRLRHTEIYCSTMSSPERAVVHCRALQKHTATHFRTLQRMAKRVASRSTWDSWRYVSIVMATNSLPSHLDSKNLGKEPCGIWSRWR